MSHVNMFVCFYIIQFVTFNKIQCGERKVEVAYINWGLERKNVVCKMELLLQRMSAAEMRNGKLISF